MSTDRYYVKCSRACKTPGQPQSKVGRDMEGFYTYPAIGHYLSESDALSVRDQLAKRFPGALIFVQLTPAAFDGVSVPGL